MTNQPTHSVWLCQDAHCPKKHDNQTPVWSYLDADGNYLDIGDTVQIAGNKQGYFYKITHFTLSPKMVFVKRSGSNVHERLAAEQLIWCQ